jgi:hypothetical protein
MTTTTNETANVEPTVANTETVKTVIKVEPTHVPVNRLDGFPEIKNDVPPPERRERTNRNWKLFWKLFPIDSYIDVPSRQKANDYVSNAYNRDIKLQTKKQAGGVIRIWRRS